MDLKTGLMVLMFLVGCIALPTPKENDVSKFFKQVDVRARIVGGSVAPAGSHPHMVALVAGLLIRSLICGASLVSRRTVLTAAHCIGPVYGSGSLLSSLRASVGTNRWNSGGTDYRIERNVTHPGYDLATISNDIGILITTNEVILNNLVQVIPISFEHTPGGVQSRVAGWGRIGGGSATSVALLELTTTTTGDECVGLVAQASIDLDLPAPPVDPEIKICVFRGENFGTCNGDSGSALFSVDTGEQIGVVSWGLPCALGAPDVFVRLSAFQNWLQTYMV